MERHRSSETRPARGEAVRHAAQARGQLDAVIRMLEEGGGCEQAVTQLSAAAKAIDRAAYAIIATGMRQ